MYANSGPEISSYTNNVTEDLTALFLFCFSYEEKAGSSDRQKSRFWCIAQVFSD